MRTAMMRLCVVLLVACGGSRAQPPPAPTPHNVAPPTSDAAVTPADAPCAKACMDTCCEADEVCQHGQLGDGTMAHCRRMR